MIRKKWAKHFKKLAEEDPTFRVSSNEETGQTLIGGMGELHLEILVDRMKREFKVEANVGKPQVAYKETIRKKLSQKENLFVNLVVKVSSVMFGLNSNQTKKEKVTNLKMQLLAERFQENLSNQQMKELKRL